MLLIVTSVATLALIVTVAGLLVGMVTDRRSVPRSFPGNGTDSAPGVVAIRAGVEGFELRHLSGRVVPICGKCCIHPGAGVPSMMVSLG